MFRSGQILIAVAVLAVSFTASRAEAGFVSVTSERFDFEGQGSGFGMTVPAQESPAPSRTPFDPVPIHNAIAPGQTDGGMGSQGSSGSGGGSNAPAIANVSPVPVATGLAVRLALQREPFHPRFVKSRIFRPPRD